MRDASLSLSRSRGAYDDRSLKRAKSRVSLVARVFNFRRLSMITVLGIAGLAAIGVPMNALFFQDGHHPSPIFAGHTPPASNLATVGVDEKSEPVKNEAAKVEATTPRTAPVRASETESNALASLAAAPLTAKPARPALAKPETKPAIAKPAATKPAAAKSAAKRVVPKPAASATADLIPPKAIPAKAGGKTAAKTATAKTESPDLISRLLGIGAEKPTERTRATQTR